MTGIRVVALCALLLSFVGCKRAEMPDSPPQPTVSGDTIQFRSDSPQLAALKSDPAQAEGEHTVAVSGRLAWDETCTTRVFAPVAGRIVSLDAAPGSRVRRGQVLARLTSPEFGQVQAEAARAQADLAQAEKNLARARYLDEAGIIAKRDLQAAEADMARARAEAARTRARLRSYGAGADVDQVFPLRSPIAGTVVERNANVGQEFRPDQAASGTPALFVLSDPGRLWALIDLPEGAASTVHVGQEIELTADALPGEMVKARIEFVADALDPVTRTFKARATVPNEQRRLKAEMFVRGQLRLPGSGAPVVPAAGVVLVGNGHYVFVDQGGGRYLRRSVDAQDAGVERMRVVKGLQPGERVVTQGALFLQQILSSAAP
ncbi:MAG: efflux RND transporter periplasmic adaptor subunit [Pseudomonadota bacterium]|jgi:cobalt-zinc-cadmium efflux system membrane fusion protein